MTPTLFSLKFSACTNRRKCLLYGKKNTSKISMHRWKVAKEIKENLKLECVLSGELANSSLSGSH